MYLNDYLQTLDPNQIVAIGTKSGEGFLYIEKAGDTESISKRFKNYLKNIMSGLEYKQALIKELFVNPPKLTGDLDADWPVISERCDLIQSTHWRMCWDREYIRDFTPVLGREVLEDYDRSIDDAIVVIVDGDEHGTFWFHEEYLEVYPVKEG